MNLRSDLIRVKPADVERISGLSVGMQRDWRKRGFLAQSEGHARFDCFDVAEVLVRRKLSERGIGPAKSGVWALMAAFGIVSKALMSPDAYAWAYYPLNGEEILGLRKRILEEAQGVRAERLPAGSEDAIEQASQYLVWWSDEASDLVWTSSLDRTVKHRSPAKSTMPAVFLDVHAEAANLLREFGHLVALEDASEMPLRPVRRGKVEA